MTPNLTIPWENISRRYSRYYIYLEPVVKDPLIRGYFSFVASIILVAFFMIFALSPTVNTILTLQKKIAEQKKLITNMDEKIANLVTAQENYSQIQSSLTSVLLALPLNPSPQAIISGVNEFASGSGATVSDLQFQDIPLSKDTIKAAQQQILDSTGLPTVNFSLTVSGPMDKVRTYLGDLENLSRLIHLKSLSVNSQQVSVTGLGYYLVDKTNE